jgi:Cu2+-exporting ATPase
MDVLASVERDFVVPADRGQAGACFHCGEANPPGSRWRHAIDGRERDFCCAGCLAIASTIAHAGLTPFYEQRTATSPRAQADDEARARHAAAAIAAGLVSEVAPGECEAALLLEGLTCGACVWLIESWLRRQSCVLDAQVNFATRRARVRWQGPPSDLARVLAAIAAVGYRAFAYDAARREALGRRESRALLLRMGVAVLSMMQVMMLAVPAYLGDDTVEPAHQSLLDWASLVLALPAVLFSAWPFFRGAWRSVRVRRLGMDVPVALGVAGAFAASVWATVTGHGVVYFDSVTMFVALLLVARYAELRAREKAAGAIEGIARDLPLTAARLPGYPTARILETIAARELAAGEMVLVAAGDTVPADGVVVEGASNVEEALLTGESRPLRKTSGDRVLAGSLNRASPLVVRVAAAGGATTLAALSRLVERAADARPRSVALAERVAAWFVAALLIVAGGALLFWWSHDPSRALAVAFAVLVVSCPCALSLATPAAVAAGAGALGRRGVLAVRPDAMETLARTTHVVLDKTGTLTFGHPRLVRVEPLAGLDRDACLAIAAALEEGVAHPVALALRDAAVVPLIATERRASPGDGVEGVVEEKRYRLGRPQWVAALAGRPMPRAVRTAPAEALVAALADETGWLAVFTFEDALRPGSRALVGDLKRLGVHVTLLSGDRAEAVERIAREAGIAQWRAAARPEDKCAFIRARQREGAVVAMAGDGINDAPALAQADVSLAMGRASALAQWTADVVVLGDDAATIAAAFGGARRTWRVIRQNLGWALAYNAIAIPLAAAGLVSPLAAALGMSLSSLFVVANALRLVRG